MAERKLSISKNIVNILAYGLPSMGLICIVLYSFTAYNSDLANPFKSVLYPLTTFFFIGGSSYISGILLGFLFGLPRYEKVNNEQNSNNYSPNTNLEQVSDWLTKILLGISLVNIDKIASFLSNIAEVASQNLGTLGTPNVFILGLIIYLICGGFLNGYLGTRIFLPKILSDSEKLEDET